MKKRLALCLIGLAAAASVLITVSYRFRIKPRTKPHVAATADRGNPGAPRPEKAQAKPILTPAHPEVRASLKKNLFGARDSEAKLKAEGREARLEREGSEAELEREDQPAEAAEFYRLKRAPNGQGPIPVERYLTARAKIKNMLRYSTPAGRMIAPESKAEQISPDALGTWTPLGPGNIGGRTRAILIDPGNPNTMYAAGVAGGRLEDNQWRNFLDGA